MARKVKTFNKSVNNALCNLAFRKNRFRNAATIHLSNEQSVTEHVTMCCPVTISKNGNVQLRTLQMNDFL
jgi:hypothetical protein